MDLGLKDKIALITGGSHGIGLAIKELLLSEGCTVHSISRREGYDVLIDNDIARATTLYADSDILINNIGGGGRWGEEEPTLTQFKVWQEVYKKNAEAAIKFTMACLPYMLENKWGRVITIASIYGKEGGGRPWFNMAKAAEISLMKCLALRKEYQEANITFNTICPGAIWIEGKKLDKYERYGKPEDVAGIVAFLCSDYARWINGACITADGGESRSF